ncbi:MAG: arylsulfatase A-like enzyme [Planctomycetota bacterium]|jgi:arylsulfatase A-like enzyme
MASLRVVAELNRVRSRGLRKLPGVVYGVALGLALLSLACADNGGASSQRPNVVLIVVDTLRADVIRDKYGLVDTPEIDRFASEGVPFVRAYTHAPMTLPAHTALFSSRLPVESGVLNNSQNVPDDLPLLAEWMQRYGYSTRAVLSIGTLTPNAGEQGLSRGFESYDTDLFHLDRAENVTPRMRSMLESWPAFNGTEEQPFFLFAHFSDPHAPYRSHAAASENVVVTLDGEELGAFDLSDAPQLDLDLNLTPGEHVLEIRGPDDNSMRVRVASLRTDKNVPLTINLEEGQLFEPSSTLRGRFVSPAGQAHLRLWMHDIVDGPSKKLRYLSEVEHIDNFVGELLQILRDSGTYDETMVILVSDHGEALGERALYGHVSYLFDPIIHVPLIMKLPGAEADLGKAQPGMNGNEPVSLIDLAPTILEICGLPDLPGQRGHSLLSARDEPFEHIAETHKPEAPQDRLSLFDGTLRMVYIADEDRFQLFDLDLDPREKNDVFAARGDERPEWPERLRLIAQQAARIASEGNGPDIDRASVLRALGY